MPLLEVKDLAVRYDKAAILNGVSLEVGAGEFVGVVGPNGAGKSTLLRAISGLVRFEERMKRGAEGDIVLEGEVRFAGDRIDGLEAHEIRKRGLVHCPERRRPFRELTVEENLLAGAYLSRSSAERRRNLDRSYALFPRLAERKKQLAGKLSGGEQQMLATARALMYEAKLLAIDEPSLGSRRKCARSCSPPSRRSTRRGRPCCWWSRKWRRSSGWRVATTCSRRAGSSPRAPRRR